MIDEGPLLGEQRASLIHGLMTAFDPNSDIGASIDLFGSRR
jgi:hypothetical protein